MFTTPKPNTKSVETATHVEKKGNFSPLKLIGVGVTLVLALVGAGALVIQPHISDTHAAAAVNMNCTLVVPNNPLSAQGLATPYKLVATNPANGACNEANANQSAFVQAAILNPATGKISIYSPLVTDQNTLPAIAPTPPQLPANAVVGLWFGDNGMTLTVQQNAQGKVVAQPKPKVQMQLTGAGMNNGNCVNGVANSPFGQFAYCNAPNFFAAANVAIKAGKLVIPPLGTAKDGQACPTTRSFAIVDMDQSDNVQTQYLVNANGQTAQLTAANQAKLANATTIGNPSDNALVTRFVDPALGCQPFQAPDIANNNTPVSALALDELQAAAKQQAPVALVPANDPMVLNNNQTDLNKINAYRVGVDQTPAATLNNANTTTYCQNLVKVALPRLKLDMTLFQNQASPDKGATANSLFTFLANRLNATLGANGLNCVGLLKIQNPVALTMTNGIVTAATITTVPVPAAAAAAPANNAAAPTK